MRSGVVAGERVPRLGRCQSGQRRKMMTMRAAWQRRQAHRRRASGAVAAAKRLLLSSLLREARRARRTSGVRAGGTQLVSGHRTRTDWLGTLRHATLRKDGSRVRREVLGTEGVRWRARRASCCAGAMGGRMKGAGRRLGPRSGGWWVTGRMLLRWRGSRVRAPGTRG
jgi:hypothetical protein